MFLQHFFLQITCPVPEPYAGRSPAENLFGQLLFPWRNPLISSLIRRPKSLPALVCFLLLAVCGVQAFAQAMPTRFKTQDIFVFGAYTYTDIVGLGVKDKGIMGGADYTRYLHFSPIVHPSFEVRFTHDGGDYISQNSILFGLKLRADFHGKRYHPYATGLYGGTHLHFNQPSNPNYTHDSATTYAGGGGLDIDAYHNIGVKLEYMRESSNYGFNGGTVPFKLTPNRYSFGVIYRIP